MPEEQPVMSTVFSLLKPIATLPAFTLILEGEVERVGKVAENR